MSNSISQTPATVVIYCGNQVLSAPRGGFAAGAGASEMRPYQDDMVDLHPALSSPSATPRRSGGYVDKVKRADGTSASADAANEKRALWKVRQGTKGREPN